MPNLEKKDMSLYESCQCVENFHHFIFLLTMQRSTLFLKISCFFMCLVIKTYKIAKQILYPPVVVGVRYRG